MPYADNNGCGNLAIALPGTHALTFPALTANSLTVLNGQVNLQQSKSGDELTLLGRDKPGIEGEEDPPSIPQDALLVDENGKLVLGLGTYSIGEMSLGGGAATGTGGGNIDISNLAVVNANDVRIDDVDATTTLSVEGRFTIHGLLIAGLEKNGTVIVGPSPFGEVGRFNVDDSTAVGFLSGSSGQLFINGKAEDAAFVNIALTLNIGLGGVGNMTLGPEKSRLTCNDFAIARDTGSSGMVDISGDASLIVSNDAVIGGGGLGKANLTGAAALLEAKNTLTVGSEQPGLGELRIIEGKLHVAETILLPFQGDGLMIVDLGATADCNDLLIGGDAAEAGGSLHIGTLASLTARNSIQIGNQAGPALLQIGQSGILNSPGQMEIGPQGLVRIDTGSAITAGTLINHGRLFTGVSVVIPNKSADSAPKAATGPAVINGTFTNAPDGTLSIALGQGALLRINGPATLGGALEVLLEPGVAYTEGQQFTLLDFAGGVSGAFDSVTFPNGAGGFAGTVAVNGGTLQLTVTHAGSGAEGEGEGEGEGPGCAGCNAKALPSDPWKLLERLVGDNLILLASGVMLLVARRIYSA